MHIPMKRLLPLIAWCLCLAGLPPASAQSVGLVLSGGGAKGMAHIGVIKALEENGIPIDYVAGTSMGAIVGGMYAIGMTPEEMVALLKSDDFKRWSTGEVEQRYIYYYKNADPSHLKSDCPMSVRNPLPESPKDPIVKAKNRENSRTPIE